LFLQEKDSPQRHRGKQKENKRDVSGGYLMMNRRSKVPDPQELKPAYLLALGGTAEAVPFPNDS
jgi:hypothetical protein